MNSSSGISSRLIVVLGSTGILLAACGSAYVESVALSNGQVEQVENEVEPLAAIAPAPLLLPPEPLLIEPQGFGFELPVVPSEPEPNQPFSVPPPSLVGRSLVVDQGLQMMGVFEDGVEVQRFAISSGRPTYTAYTLAWNGYVGKYIGTFQSYTGGKADNAWFLYQATGAILIHGLPYHEVDGEKQYYDADALGNYPASAGCIRVAPDNMQWLTDEGLLNVPITITDYPGPIEGLLLFDG